MSAVLSAFATAPPRRPQWRFGRAAEIRAFGATRRAAPAPLVDLADIIEVADTDLADLADDADLGEAKPTGAGPEALLLAHCAAEIAAEAGASAPVHAIGAPRQATLLRAAIAALPGSAAVPSERIAAARSIVYLPQHAVANLAPDALLAMLRRVAAQHGADALLVVAIETTPGRSGSCFDRLAGVAGWQLCQLWSDGFARHALHVLERSARAALARAS